MRAEVEVELRADVAAEKALAEAFSGNLSQDQFREDEIGALREVFKLGWIRGFKAAMEEVR